MKTTNSKDSVKVNQILPIMQEHFGQSQGWRMRFNSNSVKDSPDYVK